MLVPPSSTFLSNANQSLAGLLRNKYTIGMHEHMYSRFLHVGFGRTNTILGPVFEAVQVRIKLLMGPYGICVRKLTWCLGWFAIEPRTTIHFG